MTATPLLEALDVRKSYGATAALAGVDLRIASGQVVALLGRNGAGKTTLLSIVANLRAPDGGTVQIDGELLTGGRSAASAVGYASQEVAVYPSLTAGENLRFVARLGGLRSDAARARITAVSRDLEIEHLLDSPARFLSGGERRRLHVSMALLHQPRLLLLDEPTAGVDVESRERILDAVRRVAERGAAVCYSTHYLTEVEALAAAVVVLERGRVIASGDLDEVIAQHGTPFVEVEVEVEGPLPAAFRAMAGEVDGRTVRIFGDVRELPRQIIAALGPDVGILRSMAVFRPSLDSVFLSLTGFRFDEEDAA